MSEPTEVLPGVLHWTARHPNLGVDVSSYFLVQERILIDPIAPDAGDPFADARPETILLTNRHHLRSALELKERFGATLRAPRTGMHDLPEEHVEPYDFGDELEGGIRAHGVLEDWPDETALEIPAHRALAIADGVINYAGLGFVPDQILGDDAEHEKELLREAFARVAEQIDFDHLLPAHGAPVIGNARDELRRFVGS